MDDTVETKLNITVIIPTYNEETAIAECLDALLAAEHSGDKEILVVDGHSEDQTRKIVDQYQQKNDCIQLYDNPERTTPHGINIGLEHASGDVITFVGGHSVPPADFFASIVTVFNRVPDADVVGGRMAPAPSTYFEHAVTAALVSPLGSSSTRFQSIEGYVETVNFGAYRREVIETVGKMNTELPRAQDYEYNRRVRDSGFRIYQHPSLEIGYIPRSTPLSLAKQYYGNGYWKTTVFREFGDYPLPPRILGLGTVAFALFMIPFWALLFGGYLVLLNLVAISSIKKTRSKTRLWHVPGAVVSLLVMHACFAAGLFQGTVFPSH